MNNSINAEMFLGGKIGDIMKAAIAENPKMASSTNLDDVFSLFEKRLAQKTEEVIACFSENEKKSIIATYENLCAIKDYRFRVYLLVAFNDYLEHLAKRDDGNTGVFASELEVAIKQSLKKKSVKSEDCLSYEQLRALENEVDAKIKAKLETFSEEFDKITHKTLCTIKNIYTRKAMKDCFYKYLEVREDFQPEATVLSHEQFKAKEKEIDVKITEKINAFSEETQSDLSETLETLSSINNSHSRIAMKSEFYKYLEECEELMEEDE